MVTLSCPNWVPLEPTVWPIPTILPLPRPISTRGRADANSLAFILLFVRVGDDVCIFCDKYFTLRIHPAFLKHLEFAKKLDRVQDASVPDDTFYPEENTGGNLVRDELLPFMKNGVSCIRAAVVAEHVGIGVFMA